MLSKYVKWFWNLDLTAMITNMYNVGYIGVAKGFAVNLDRFKLPSFCVTFVTWHNKINRNEGGRYN